MFDSITGLEGGADNKNDGKFSKNACCTSNISCEAAIYHDHSHPWLLHHYHYYNTVKRLDPFCLCATLNAHCY